jgi:hypothetical protein
MNQELEQALQQIADEKGISREEIIAMIEASLAAAFRKDYGEKDQNVEVTFVPDNLSARIFDVKHVVELVEDPQKEIDVVAAQEWQEGAKTFCVRRWGMEGCIKGNTQNVFLSEKICAAVFRISSGFAASKSQLVRIF